MQEDSESIEKVGSNHTSPYVKPSRARNRATSGLRLQAPFRNNNDSEFNKLRGIADEKAQTIKIHESSAVECNKNVSNAESGKVKHRAIPAHT